MKAITVEPHKPGQRPPRGHTRARHARRVGARRSHRGRRLRDRRRDRRGQVRLGAAGPDRAWCSGTSRSAGSSTRARPAAFGRATCVVGIVRRPDPVPCPNCAVGEWDMCRNGQYTERGIKQIDGFMSERWRIEPEYAMKVDRSLGLLGVLLEPTTVVAKAWEQVPAVGQRAFWEPRNVLVTGAGPIGLLAALVGRQHGLDVHVLDRVETGPKPELVRALGATYHSGPRRRRRLRARRHHRVHRRRPGDRRLDPTRSARGGVVCLTGVGSGGRTDRARRRRRRRRRWCCRTTSSSAASTPTSGTGTRPAQVLARADRAWLARLITRRETPERFMQRAAPSAGRHQGRHPVRRA